MKRSLPVTGSSNSSTSNNAGSGNNQAYFGNTGNNSNFIMPAAFGTSPQGSSSELLALLLSQQQQQHQSQQSQQSLNPPQNSHPNAAFSSQSPFPQGQAQVQVHQASSNTTNMTNPRSSTFLPNDPNQMQLQQNNALIARLTRQLASGTAGTDPAVAAALMASAAGLSATGGVSVSASPGAVAMSVGSHSHSHSASTQPVANTMNNTMNNSSMSNTMNNNTQAPNQSQSQNGIPSVVQFPSADAAAQQAQAQAQAQLQALAAAATTAQQRQQQQQQQAQQQQQGQMPRPTTPSTYIRQMHSQLFRNFTSSSSSSQTQQQNQNQQQQQQGNLPANVPSGSQNSHSATSHSSSGNSANNNSSSNSNRIVPLANLNTDAPTTTAIGKMNPKKLFVLVRILLAYLEKSDPELHAEAEKIIKECKRKKKAGHIAYGSLSQAIGTRLRLAVGDEHWKMACQIHKRLEHGHANLQKTKRYKKGQKLNAAPKKNNDSGGTDENSADSEGGKADASSSNKRVTFGEGV